MPSLDDEDLLAIADEAARSAAQELLARFGEHAENIHAKSSPTDLVSEADVSAEKAIRAVLTRRVPDDAVLGEEGGATGEGERRWIVDPLDGTINFLFGIPVFAVSVACEIRGETVAGVVLDPIRDECFSATRTGPAVMNGKPIQAASRDDLSRVLVATGFGYESEVRARQAAVVSRVLPRVRDIRRAGAAAIDLAWCARGRYDAYYERGVKHWDVAAGSLVAKRAGLEVRQLAETDADASGVVAAPPGVIDELMELIVGDEGGG